MLYIKLTDMTFFCIDPGINFWVANIMKYAYRHFYGVDVGKKIGGFSYDGPKIMLALVFLSPSARTKKIMEQNLWLFK